MRLVSNLIGFGKIRNYLRLTDTLLSYIIVFEHQLAVVAANCRSSSQPDGKGWVFNGFMQGSAAPTSNTCGVLRTNFSIPWNTVGGVEWSGVELL
jgi:hypothetical protein